MKYEIESGYGDWVEVTEDIFRSWTGGRRINGEEYTGPVFYLFTDRIARQSPTVAYFEQMYSDWTAYDYNSKR
jgi:hypothetical protein